MKNIRIFLIFFILANFYILLANVPLLIRYLRIPDNHIFPMTHSDAYHDYALYLSVITQGKNGFWLYQDPYTTTRTLPGIFYSSYILIGKVAAIFDMWPPVAYHLARILFSEIYIILIFILSFLLLGSIVGFWGALFSVLATISPPIFFKESIVFPSGIPWWFNFDAIQRFNDIPHNLFGQDLLLLTIILFILYFQREKIVLAIFAGLTILLAGINFPPVLAITVIPFPLSFITFTITDSIYRKKFTINIKIFLGMSVIVAFSFLSLFLIKWQESQGFPWNIWTPWNVARWNVYEQGFNRSFISVFGIVTIFAIPAIISVFFKRNILKYLLVFWAVTPFLLLPMANFLNLPKIRIVQGSPFVPFGYLTAITIFQIDVMNKQKKVQLLLIILFIIISLPVSIWTAYERINFVKSENNFPGYMPLKEYEAITFIEKNVPKGSNFISYEYSGNLLPALTPVKSYIGHMTQTDNFSQKLEITKKFITNTLTNQEAAKLVSENNIKYVYFGSYERELNPKMLNYSFLKPVFQNQKVTVYNVK